MVVTTLTIAPDKERIDRHLRCQAVDRVSVKGGAVMTTRHVEPEAEQRERQARIEQDIRELFARYRRSDDTKRRESERPVKRFVREAERTTLRTS
jgi:hypothetical protein